MKSNNRSHGVMDKLVVNLYITFSWTRAPKLNASFYYSAGITRLALHPYAGWISI